MKAIAYTQNGAASVLTDLQLPAPTPGPRDLLVQVQAISVNPVDTKVRSGAAVTEPRVLGWDAVGIVQQVGDQVSLFKVGDSVFYAGAIDRPGSNSERVHQRRGIRTAQQHQQLFQRPHHRLRCPAGA